MDFSVAVVVLGWVGVMGWCDGFSVLALVCWVFYVGFSMLSFLCWIEVVWCGVVCASVHHQAHFALLVLALKPVPVGVFLGCFSRLL